MVTTHVAQHFARVAAHYQAVRITDEEPVIDIVGRLPAGAVRGLEVGCGPGRYTKPLLRHLGAGSSIVPLDACWAMISRLRQAANVERRMWPVCGDAAALPVRDGCFDFVATFNAVHHFDLERFLAGAASALRPGGRLFVYTRTPEQNGRSVWGREFPGFRQRETRLHRRGRLEQAVANTSGLALVGIREYAFERRATLDTLKRRVQARAYSTFALYGEAELAVALARFEDALSDPVEWVDENTLVVAARR